MGIGNLNKSVGLLESANGYNLAMMFSRSRETMIARLLINNLELFPH
jgi:hypothetical protein